MSPRPAQSRLALLALLLAGAGCVPPASSGRPAGPSMVPGAPPPGPVDPHRALSAAQRRWVDSTLATLSLHDRVAQLVMPWVLGDYVNADAPAFVQVRRWITEDHVGGVVMSLGSPIEVAAKINAMQRLAPIPLLVASDLEPGLGRLEGGVFTPSLTSAGSATVLPSAMAIGAAGSTTLAREAGRVTGLEARAVGIRLVFAPVADVNNNPDNPVINVRSFGEDPQRVAELTAAFTAGLESAGVAATLKHFPGHGDTDADSHLRLPVVTSDAARLDSVELVPFRRAIDAGAAGVMTAHIALPAIGGDSTPATLRPAIMTGLLRDSLDFDGLVVTDALTMQGIGRGYGPEESVVLALRAGADILLMPADVPGAIAGVLAAVERGELSAERITASTRRVLEWKVRTGTIAEPIVSLETLRQLVGAPAHWRLADTIAARAVTLLRDSTRLVPIAAGQALAVLTYAPELDVAAGRTFAAELRAHFPRARVVRASPTTTAADLAALARELTPGSRLVVTTHVRTIEGEGGFAVAPAVAAWVDSVAHTVPTTLVSFSNPYVIRQFPSVGAYLATYGRGEALERAAARALAGLAPITGRAPISLPGYFRRGDGLQRGGQP
ncbi:MAG TPA: glycoside hydrolase family 3 N-terminal domain-containing protein [Gemmatimonadaceae bacterium]|nr:glycoside hydrolase family 3 N-terminal domain-containing protein [Gemmatimonadaceae bacterium]